jgi:hypothetical protein
MSQPKRTWIAAFIILLISWCTYQGYESLYFFRIPFYIKHLINFTLLISVAVTGYVAFIRFSQNWIIPVWSISYLIIIALMGFVGILDLFFKFEISNFRELIHNLRLFFTSPVPFGILLFLSRKMDFSKTVLPESTNS